MSRKSVAQEAREILLASEMIRLGARLQVLQAETSLSYERLGRLYREIRKCSPPKGMLPYSVDWFVTWLPNIHATLFYSHYQFLNAHTATQGSDALVAAYRLYLEQAGTGQQGGPDEEPVLSFTRAWVLLRFIDSNMLQLSRCSECSGHFLMHTYEPDADFVCGICRPPPRAGKRRVRRYSRKKRV